MDLTPDQIITARKLLGWSAELLAKRSDCSVRTVWQVESDRPRGDRATKAVGPIRRTLEAAGVIFVVENDEGPAVRLRKGATP